MSIYKIKRCSKEEKPLLIEFINKYWKEDHVFVKSDELFDFQHYNRISDDYNFLIGWNTISNEIDGIVGLIPVSHYDVMLYPNNESWGGIWKIREDVYNDEIGVLGLLLFEWFYKTNLHISIGLSPIAIKLNKVMKYKTGYMNQFFILNEKRKKFDIAKIPLEYKYIVPENHNKLYCIKKVQSEEALFAHNNITVKYHPVKSINYLYNRYLKHPIYKYKLWGVYRENELELIFVTRSIFIRNSSVIRIVDALGNFDSINSSLYEDFQEMLQDSDAEYIDLVNYGIDEAIIEAWGFDKLDTSSNELVIPEYFEPFVRENHLLNYAYKSKEDIKVVIFKGDADQDRPNII